MGINPPSDEGETVRQFRMRAVRTDYEEVAVTYEFFVSVEAESREEAIQMMIDGEYDEGTVEEYNTLNTDPCETLEVGDVEPESIDILSEGDDEPEVEEPTSQFP